MINLIIIVPLHLHLHWLLFPLVDNFLILLLILLEIHLFVTEIILFRWSFLLLWLGLLLLLLDFIVVVVIFFISDSNLFLIIWSWKCLGLLIREPVRGNWILVQYWHLMLFMRIQSGIFSLWMFIQKSIITIFSLIKIILQPNNPITLQHIDNKIHPNLTDSLLVLIYDSKFLWTKATHRVIDKVFSQWDINVSDYFLLLCWHVVMAWGF